MDIVDSYKRQAIIIFFNIKKVLSKRFSPQETPFTWEKRNSSINYTYQSEGKINIYLTTDIYNKVQSGTIFKNIHWEHIRRKSTDICKVDFINKTIELYDSNCYHIMKKWGEENYYKKMVKCY